MDATSPQVPSEFNNMCNMIFETKNPSFTPTLVRKTTIVKYAKLPDYDFESKGKFISFICVVGVF